jgi:putative spermidine/putrescine transport system ATP-binding protein
MLALLGPSGAGKSTLLSAITGLVRPDVGQIYLGDRDISQAPVSGRGIGMVFQDYSLFSSMSVKENLAFPLVAREVRDIKSFLIWPMARRRRELIRSKVDWMLELLRLSAHAGKKPSQLSGGEQQRVALGRALIFDPELLCLDEPFSALDKDLRTMLQLEIRRLQQTLSKTMIYVTHDQAEALATADRIAIINCGNLEQVGYPRDVYDFPKNRFVASFLGDCNILDLENRVSCIGEYGERAVYTKCGTRFLIRQGAAGSTHSIGVRPENLRIGVNPSSTMPNHEATIRSVVFKGASSQIQVELTSGDKLLVLVYGEGLRYRPGDKVFVGYDPKSVFVLQDTTLC